MKPRSLALALLVSSLAACGDGAKPTIAATSASADAPAPAIDGKLDSALKAVEARDPSPAASAAAPPATGIFGPGEADRAHAMQGPPKVELLDDGSEPRLSLHAAPLDPKQTTELLVSLSTGGQQSVPPLSVGLELFLADAEKKGDKKGEPEKADAPAPAPAGDPRWVAKITSMKVAGGGANIPKELSDTLAKMKGSKLFFTMGKTGPYGFSRELAKDAAKELDVALRGVEDAISTVYVPAPDKPVGDGAYWMVTDRRPTLGVDAVRYRVFRLVKVDGDRAHLSLDVRQYAGSDAIDLPLGPQLAGATLESYACAGKGIVEVAPKSMLPPAAQFAIRVQAAVVPPGAKAQPGGQRGQMMIELVGQLGAEPSQVAIPAE